MRHLFRNKRGQGTTEYIVILAILVAVALFLNTKLKPKVGSKIDSVASDIQNAGS